MTSGRLVSCSALLTVLLTAGCAGKIRYPQYYVLEIPPAPIAAKDSPRLLGTVGVRRFETPPYLRQRRIVYRQAPVEVGFYEYHRWAAEPAVMVSSAVIDSLRSSQSFSFVEPYNGQCREDYVMSGQLERLEEIDSADGVKVTAKLSAELIDLHTGATIWTGERAETLRVEARTVNGVVLGMSQAVQKCVEDLVAGLNQRLSTKLQVAR